MIQDICPYQNIYLLFYILYIYIYIYIYIYNLKLIFLNSYYEIKTTGFKSNIMQTLFHA